MPDQHEYIVQVADRETGKFSNLKIRAVDADAARDTATAQGWLVESVRLATRSPESVESQTYNALDRADRLRRRRDSIRSAIVVFVVIPGVVILAIWLLG